MGRCASVFLCFFFCYDAETWSWRKVGDRQTLSTFRHKVPGRPSHAPPTAAVNSQSRVRTTPIAQWRCLRQRCHGQLLGAPVCCCHGNRYGGDIYFRGNVNWFNLVNWIDIVWNLRGILTPCSYLPTIVADKSFLSATCQSKQIEWACAISADRHGSPV